MPPKHTNFGTNKVGTWIWDGKDMVSVPGIATATQGKTANAQIEARLLFGNNFIGKIVGAEGKNLDALRRETGCRVMVWREDKTPLEAKGFRLVLLAGTRDQVSHAAKNLLERNKDDPRLISAWFLVRPHEAEPLMDSFGADLALLRCGPSSAVAVDLELTGLEYYTVSIIGSPQRVVETITQMFAHVAAAVSLGPTPERAPVEIVNRPGSGCLPGNAPEGKLRIDRTMPFGVDLPCSQSKEDVTLHILVLDQSCGFLVGKSGSGFSQIRAASGADVQLTQPGAGPREAHPHRVLTIRGTTGNVFAALKACIKLVTPTQQLGDGVELRGLSMLIAKDNMTPVQDQYGEDLGVLASIAALNSHPEVHLGPDYAWVRVLGTLAGVEQAVFLLLQAGAGRGEHSLVSLATPKGRQSRNSKEWPSQRDQTWAGAWGGPNAAPVTVSIPISEKLMGFIVGRGGTGFRTLREMCKVEIEAARHCLPDTQIRAVIVTGSPVRVHLVELIVNMRLSHFNAKEEEDSAEKSFKCEVFVPESAVDRVVGPNCDHFYKARLRTRLLRGNKPKLSRGEKPLAHQDVGGCTFKLHDEKITPPSDESGFMGPSAVRLLEVRAPDVETLRRGMDSLVKQILDTCAEDDANTKWRLDELVKESAGCGPAGVDRRFQEYLMANSMVAS